MKLYVDRRKTRGFGRLMATDLTFEQIATALPANAVAVENGSVVINISALTGDPVAALTDGGVLEAMYKLIQGCTAAQTTVNETAADGEALAAFSVGAFGGLQQLDNGDVVSQVNATVSSILKLNADNVTGPNV